MGFSCECEYDGPEFFSCRTVKARKSHRCCECGEMIEPGDEYEYVSGKWEGDFATYCTCERCADLRDSYVGLGYCYFYGSLWSDHRDMLEADGKTDTRAYRLALKILSDRNRRILEEME